MIGKGTEWGTQGVLPEGAPIANTDASLRRLVNEARLAGHDVPIVGLAGGSLWRTLGGASVPARLRSMDTWRYPIDVVRVRLDGRDPTWFVGHLVARSPRWRQLFVAMNAQWLGRYRLGHRAHPNDGLADVYEAALGLGELWKVSRRARTGSHLPHPSINERRVRTLDVTFDNARLVQLDGSVIGQVKSLSMEVEPDALTVVL